MTAQQLQKFLLNAGKHPLGIKPSGNFLFESGDEGFVDSRRIGLGSLHALSDELICQILYHLESRDLCNLACTSKILYAWSHYDEFWKHLVISHYPNFIWSGNCWRDAFAFNYAGAGYQTKKPTIKGRNIYSDFLFQPWLCSSMDIAEEWLTFENVDVVGPEFSPDEFIEKYEWKNIPVLIRGGVENWSAIKKWTCEYLIDKYGGTTFTAEAIDTTLENYIHYAKAVREETPFYLFDKNFCEKCPDMSKDFEVPKYFNQDLFSLLGDSRPDHRWLIIGPVKSGSSFHKDPNATSAWNATIMGRKKWMMLPPETCPPGVYPSSDGSEVITPHSLMEWFINFYPSFSAYPDRKEFISRPGDLVFVPSGWWHSVINIDDINVAITQNYVSDRNVDRVLNFLNHQPQNISGICDENYAFKMGFEFEKAYLEKFSENHKQLRPAAQCKNTTWREITKDSDELFKFSF